MSTTANTTYAFVSQKIAIYYGIPVFISGVLGEIFNIIVFLSLRTFRQSSCAFILTFMSFVNIGQLLTGLLSRIMISGYNVDWTETSLFYCKFRNYCLEICALTSYTCMCLATIDQYMATSFHLRWQQYFNIKKAHILCTIALIIWLLHGIPSLIWFNLSFSYQTGGISCVITNPGFQQYFTYVYVLILAGLLPMIINIIFGSMAYWNVRQIPYRTVPLVRRELDKQLTTMVLVQVVCKILIVLPYIIGLFLIYTLNLSSPSVNVAQLNFTNFITGMIYYLYFAVSKNYFDFLYLKICLFRVHFIFIFVYQNDFVNNFFMLSLLFIVIK